MAIKTARKEAGRIVTQLVNLYDPQKIILFGSAVSNTATVNDLDFLIIKKKVPLLGVERAREVRWLIETDFAADYLIITPDEWTKRLQQGDPFMNVILEKGEVLYG
ncbi:nucleotidyltransferase domain-containing protein [Candidatus Gottesmanbacteria bacterium]|nr:nucleotidyltransferase domain-containing protein [Candidatus Gottesmanbacteria bacterium]